jgi:hypothetical protein
MVADLQVCIDLFVLAQSYVDVASLKELCHHTAGSIYHYHPFHPAADGEQFWNDLRWSVIRPQVCFSAARLFLHAQTFGPLSCRVCVPCHVFTVSPFLHDVHHRR